MKKLLLACVAVAGLALAMPALASAETQLGSGQILRIQKCQSTDTVQGWTSAQGDSPLDTNNKALVFTVTNGGCIVFYSRRSADLNAAVQNVHNLSFDFKESAYLGNGAPRISVVLNNGLVLYLAAFSCNNPLSVSGGTWGRADFTGSTTTSSTACTITDSNGATYTSTSSMSAWGVFVAAHPDLVVAQTFFVADEPAVTQPTIPSAQYVIDRLSLGARYMYDMSRFSGKYCDGNEGAC